MQHACYIDVMHQPSIQVPSSVVYSDPKVDEAEESLEVVSSFFEHEVKAEREKRSAMFEWSAYSLGHTDVFCMGVKARLSVPPICP